MKGALSLITAAGILAAAASVDQTRTLVRPVPDALAARPVDAAVIDAIASGTMADLARILAEHEISAGFVFTQDERRQTKHAQRHPTRMTCMVNRFYPGGSSFSSHDVNARGQLENRNHGTPVPPALLTSNTSPHYPHVGKQHD